MGVPTSDFKILPYSPPPTPAASGSTPLITLNKASTWTHCGPLLDLSSLPPSFHSWARATVNGNLLPDLLSFLSFVHVFLADAQMDHYWLTIRATRSTHDFDIPRWHTDRNFFDLEGKGEVHWKLATTLVGPGTLFLADGAKARSMQKKTRRAMRKSKAAKHDCKVARCLGCADMQEAVRVRLAEQMKDYTVVQAKAGECSFFRVGGKDGAVHSEPVCHGDRVFVNVVPGSEQELRKLTGQWGMEFPRAWAIGVPLNS